MRVGRERRRGLDHRIQQLGGGAEAILEIQQLAQPDLQLDPLARIERARIDGAKIRARVVELAARRAPGGSVRAGRGP